MRLTVSLALLTVCALVGAAAASADQPVRTPVDNSAVFTDEFCAGASITVSTVASKEFQMNFSDGRTVITGTLKSLVTNNDTGASVEVNISGPGFIPADGNSLVLRGNSLIFTPAVEGFNGGQPALVLTSGTTTITGTGFTTVGRTRDLCAEIG
jgi:hypothetical protein